MSVFPSEEVRVGMVAYHALPHADYTLHVQVTGKKHHNTVWCDL